VAQALDEYDDVWQETVLKAVRETPVGTVDERLASAKVIRAALRESRLSAFKRLSEAIRNDLRQH
jgi:hypothetical protein